MQLEFIEMIDWCDGPLLSLASDGKKFYLVQAVNTKSGFDDIAIYTSSQQLRDIATGKISLRKVLMQTKEWFELGVVDREWQLGKERTDPLTEYCLPAEEYVLPEVDFEAAIKACEKAGQ